MRQQRTVQGCAYSISSPGTRSAANWKAMSQWLDEDRELIGLVRRRICAGMAVKETGRQRLVRQSLSLRCCGPSSNSIASWSFEELAFHLEDLPRPEAPVARLPPTWNSSKKSVPHMTIRAIRAGNMGGDQSYPYLPARVRRNLFETGKGCAARQHGHRRAHAGAERQQSPLGWGSRDGAAGEWRSRRLDRRPPRYGATDRRAA